LVYLYSTIKMIHGPINIRFLSFFAWNIKLKAPGVNWCYCELPCVLCASFHPSDIYFLVLSITSISLWFIGYNNMYFDRELDIFGMDKVSLSQERNIPWIRPSETVANKDNLHPTMVVFRISDILTSNCHIATCCRKTYFNMKFSPV
jgi:hypothetical protein